MPRLALWNLLIGFSVVFISALAGAFIAWDITENFVRNNSAELNSWYAVLTRSAHGHFNLFGYLHVLFGLTTPYSALSVRLKFFQTFALALGTVAMGPGMLLRSWQAPMLEGDLFGFIVGAMLSASLLAICAHVFGIAMKLKHANC